MAQAIVQSARAKLRSAIGDEATARWQLTSDLQEIEEAMGGVDSPLLGEAERRLMRGFKLETEEKPVREWVRRVRKSAYGISDMVDELQGTGRASPAAGKVTSILACFAVVGKKNPMAHRNRMKEMIDELKEIKLASDSLGFGGAPDFHVPDEVEEVEKEIQSIMAECDIRDGPAILAIKGHEDQAKTAFAKMLFDHTRFKHHSRVWVHLSETYDLYRIGVSIISRLSREETNIYHGSSNQDMEYITKRLRVLLNNNGSTEVLVILDGLHLKDEDCTQFNRMFCVGDKSSKVIVIATLRGDMKQSFFTKEPIAPKILWGDMCWKIIKETSGFEGRPRSDKENLEKIGREIAKQCLGKTSEAKVLGSILRYNDATGWAEALRRNLCELSERNPASQFLRIAYTIMPSSLRLCYAYCAMFPKGHPIAKDCLICQWIALGLIEPQPSDGYSATQLAEEYIRSLLDLSLLQIMKPASTSEKGAVLLTVGDVHLPVQPFIDWSLYDGLHDEFIPLKGTMMTAYQEYAKEYGRYAVLAGFDAMPLDLWGTLLPRLRALHCIRCSKMKFTEYSFSSARWLRVLEIKENSFQKLPETVCQLMHLGCLSLSGCTELITLPDSFGNLLNLVYIDLSRCSKLGNLPKSLGKLTDLEHVDLSGCSGLQNLPRSFGKLIKLSHINLSGCSGLATLPESFGNLTDLEHVDLSGCSGLQNLPQSFGNLTSLLHLDLSRCHALVVLPRSFCNLAKLELVDLSFWSSLEVIRTALAATSLQHLNLSHPCSSTAELEPQSLEWLEEALQKLSGLRYLNLSMFSHSHSEEEIGRYLENISFLGNLEHLDLSNNINLHNLPESLAGLSKLHTLDLSGCIRLKTVPNKIHEMDGLKLIALEHCRGLENYHFVVGASRNCLQLEDVNCQEMHISCLEKVKSLEEAQGIRLREKGRLVKLKLCWTPDCPELLDLNVLLREIVPPHSVECLMIHGYGGPMAWWPSSICANLSNLTEVTLEDIQSFTQLPPVGRLPNLQRLVLRRLASITRIDGCALSCDNWPASQRLSKLTIDDMPNLQWFYTRYEGGGEELIWPAIDELEVSECPELVFVPLPPRAVRLVVKEGCNKVMTPEPGVSVDRPPCIPSPAVTQLVVESCTEEYANWSLLHHLPGLHSLTINNRPVTGGLFSHRFKTSLPPHALSCLQILCFSDSNTMASLPLDFGGLNSLQELRIMSCKWLRGFPDSMKQLASLKSMHLNHCHLKALPEWLGDLTSLEMLAIHKCDKLESFPKSIGKLVNLKDLYVSESSGLKEWCESELNKEVLAHIRPKYEQFVAPDPDKQSEQSGGTKGSTSNTSKGKGGGGDGSSELSEAQPSQRLNSPPRSPQRDIYLT